MSVESRQFQEMVREAYFSLQRDQLEKSPKSAAEKPHLQSPPSVERGQGEDQEDSA